MIDVQYAQIPLHALHVPQVIFLMKMVCVMFALPIALNVQAQIQINALHACLVIFLMKMLNAIFALPIALNA